jgi:hypothetical protein
MKQNNELTAEQKRLLRGFFQSMSDLVAANIVRSDKILGDIGEWLCAQRFGVSLCQSGRHPGFDGLIAEKRIQIKIHNSPEGTNLSVGDANSYDELMVVIGPRSRLRAQVKDASSNSFLIYRFTSDEVRSLMKRSSGHYCAKGILAAAQAETVHF